MGQLGSSRCRVSRNSREVFPGTLSIVGGLIKRLSPDIAEGDGCADCAMLASIVASCSDYNRVSKLYRSAGCFDDDDLTLRMGLSASFNMQP